MIKTTKATEIPIPAFAPILSCCELPQLEADEPVQLLLLVVVLVFDIVGDDATTPLVEGVDDKLNELDVRSARL
jgi:hypothetical protein